MKLPYQQIKQHLTNKLLPLYLVSSDELLLSQETVDMIRKAARNAGFTERVLIQPDSNPDWPAEIYSETHHLSLFSTKRIVELNLTQTKLNQTSAKIVEEYALNPPADTLLIIQTNKLDSKIEKSTWFQAINKIGIIIQIWPITLEQLPQWIMQRAEQAHFTLTKEAANWLAILVEGNLLAAACEIEKLSLLKPGETLDHETIENAVTDHARFDIFTLVDSMLSGNSKRCLRILENLAAEGTEPALILWALTREVRLLAEIAKQKSRGESLSSLFSKFRIWEKRQGPVRAFLQRHTEQDCWMMLKKTAEIDRVIKGAEIGNVWNMLQDFLILKHAS
jgi:DNA polymerase-3 subunit delta